MVSMKIAEWLFPEIKKERDSALIQVHDLTQQLQRAEETAIQLFQSNQKLSAQLAAATPTLTPKVFRAATSAEVRKMAEQAFFEEDRKREEN